MTSNERHSTPIVTAIAAVTFLSIVALPAPAAFENGAADLSGTSWQGEASLRLALSSRAGGGSERLPSFNVVTRFDEDRFSVSSAGTAMQGSWAPHRRRKRHLKGVPDPGAIEDEAQDLRSILDALVEADLGRSVDLDITPRDAQIKAKLNRAGDRLTAKLRYRFKGTLRVGGRGVKFKAHEKIKVKATQVLD